MPQGSLGRCDRLPPQTGGEKKGGGGKKRGKKKEKSKYLELHLSTLDLKYITHATDYSRNGQIGKKEGERGGRGKKGEKVYNRIPRIYPTISDMNKWVTGHGQ